MKNMKYIEVVLSFDVYLVGDTFLLHRLLEKPLLVDSNFLERKNLAFSEEGTIFYTNDLQE